SDLKDKSIVLTGEFASGQRKSIKAWLENLGAVVRSGVSSKTDYLIIGSLGSPDWKFGDYGDKVAKAQAFQLKGKAIEIVQEGDFFECQPITV
ncbi:MAG: BRCT domain-containing protein, partial [Oscillospiraceae bacterium]|nr:BRCT domain-containing protein [Oscillospiraceae bacterium]